MLKKYHRIFAGIVLTLIVTYGILKIWVLKFYASLLETASRIANIENNALFEAIRNQARTEEIRYQALGWLIYYPTYFLLHIAFIYLLFNNNLKARNYLILGLTALITSLVSLWVLFLIWGFPELARFFRDQFKNLFGLPFILLAIEGGRIIYSDIQTLHKNRKQKH
ncbi:MAG: hypothetical protein CMB80_19970 [Flammeovirgaceae bacterium]|nr:hypothetical protein [Flammeovirgaceae bacterium]|tara:strand:+ start:4982 stop:5482 length:501 start_codon:yes stop_codon:yes gene_type:complete